MFCFNQVIKQGVLSTCAYLNKRFIGSINLLFFRVSPDESLFKGDCRSSNFGMVEKRHYYDCLEGETAIWQERVDIMTCAEIEKRRGLLNGQKGPTNI